MEGDPPFGVFKKFSKNKQKMINLNSPSAEKSERRDPLGFLTFVLLQKLKGGPFGDIKNFSKSLTKPKGGNSHSVDKSENLLLRNTCKKK